VAAWYASLEVVELLTFEWAQPLLVRCNGAYPLHPAADNVLPEVVALINEVAGFCLGHRRPGPPSLRCCAGGREGRGRAYPGEHDAAARTVLCLPRGSRRPHFSSLSALVRTRPMRADGPGEPPHALSSGGANDGEGTVIGLRPICRDAATACMRFFLSQRIDSADQATSPPRFSSTLRLFLVRTAFDCLSRRSSVERPVSPSRGTVMARKDWENDDGALDRDHRDGEKVRCLPG
jgi:hypothetical protein